MGNPGDVWSTITPKVGVYFKAEQIATAQQLVACETWASKIAQPVLQRADHWLQLPDTWYRNILPAPGSIFSYGKVGCPEDNCAWPSFGVGGVASFDRPFILSCPQGHIIEFADPSSAFYDTGEGIVVNGVRHYLRGVWNAFVLHALIGWGNDKGAVHDLVYAYILTGKSAYAERAILLLDALATLQPTTIGPRDFQSGPTSVEGRFHLLSSIVDRTRMHLIRAYDVLYNHPLMRTQSPSNGGMTITANIAQNMLLDYLFEHSFDPRNGCLKTMHNHEADAVRGMLGVGLVLGKADWIRWGFQEFAALLDNTLDRDGVYYETSLSYGNFSRSVFLDMAELAYNYDPQAYGTLSMPTKNEFPYNLNFYDHPKLQRFSLGFKARTNAAGHTPAFGNYHRDREYINPTQAFAPDDEWNLAERFLLRISDAEKRAELLTWLRLQSGGDITTRRNSMFSLFHGHYTNALGTTGANAEVACASTVNASPTGAAADTLQTEHTGEFITHPKNQLTSELFGGSSGFVFLRSQASPARVAVMRSGLLLPHAHDDLMGLNLYNHGYEQTGDIGYGTFGSPVHFGWGTRSVAHNLVVVNEARNRNDTVRAQIGPGASTLAFAAAGCVSYTEQDGAHHFEPADSLSVYRRGLLHVDVDESTGYLIDIFNVVGGQTHDYVFHAHTTQQGTEQITFQGITLHEVAGLWSLAGLSDPAVLYNQPGCSWGERVLTGENIRQLNVPGDTAAGRGWVPEPRNGYGFIYNLKGCTEVSAPFTAQWAKGPGDAHMRLTMLTQAVVDVYQGLGPELDGQHHHAFMVVRHHDNVSDGSTSVMANGVGNQLRSQFVAVIESDAKPAVVQAERLPIHSCSPNVAVEPFALRLELAANRSDYILYGGAADVSVTVDADENAEASTGRMVWMRLFDQRLDEALLVEVSSATLAGWNLRPVQAAYTGSVTDIDYQKSLVTVDSHLPSAGVLNNSYVYFHQPGYRRNTVYKLAGVEANPHNNGVNVLNLGGASFTLASGEIAAYDSTGLELRSKAPFPTGWAYQSDTGYLHGKQIYNTRTGTSSRIRQLSGFSEFTIEEPVLKPGDGFEVRDIQIGDTVYIPTAVSLRCLGPTYLLKTDVAIWVTPPHSRCCELEVRTVHGQWQRIPKHANGAYLFDPAEMATGEFELRFI